MSVTIPRSVQTLLDALEAHNCNPKKQGDGWAARCPAHDDRRASLSLGIGGDGKALLWCHAGCERSAILWQLGIDDSALFEPKPEPRPTLGRPRKEHPTDSFSKDFEATYDYTDENGKVLYQVVRFKGKEFRQRKPDPKGGWIWAVKGLDKVPYKLPLLLDAVQRGLIVYIVEGEKDADKLNAAGRHGEEGYVATTNSGGAGRWEKSFSHHLKDARVVIVQDKDDPGRKHAAAVADSLRGLAKTVRVVEAKAGKDASDHLEAGLPLEDLVPADEADPIADEATAEYRLSDTGNAMRFADQHHEILRYVHAWKNWLIWTGTYWRQDDVASVQDCVKKTLEAMWDEARAEHDEARLRAMRHVLSTEAAHKRAAILEVAAADPRIRASADILDRGEWLLNVQNGTIELVDGTLREHRASDHLTHCLPVEYDPNATCPKWMDFLVQVMDGRQELVEFLQRAVGYCLTGSTREQAFFMLYGTGSNGKTTFLEVLRGLFSSLAQNAEFETFLHREQESSRTDLARMRGVRLVTASEPDRDRRFSEGLMKAITGGDMITARHLYGKPFDFKPAFKLWLAANHKPVIRGTDHAIWRRVRLVPFTVTIPEADRDPDLAEKLKDELQGILTWAVQGCLAWQLERLKSPEDVTEAVTQYRDDMDSLGPFLEECCVVGSSCSVPSGDLIRVYRDWAEKNGGPRYSAIGFANVVRDRVPGAQIVKGVNSAMRRWEGIGLADERSLFDRGRAAAGEEG